MWKFCKIIGLAVAVAQIWNQAEAGAVQLPPAMMVYSDSAGQPAPLEYFVKKAAETMSISTDEVELNLNGASVVDKGGESLIVYVEERTGINGVESRTMDEHYSQQLTMPDEPTQSRTQQQTGGSKLTLLDFVVTTCSFVGFVLGGISVFLQFKRLNICKNEVGHPEKQTEDEELNIPTA
jgi:hypothetical protein